MTTLDFRKIEDKKLAGFWRRFAAICIDSMVSYVMISPMFILGLMFGFFSGRTEHSDLFGVGFLITSMACLAFYWWNRIYLQARTGQSIGKRLLGLYILTDDNTYMSVKTAWVKELSPMLEFCIGTLLPVFRKDKKRLSDIIAGTRVYYLDEKKYTIFFIIALIPILACILTPPILGFFVSYASLVNDGRPSTYKTELLLNEEKEREKAKETIQKIEAAVSKYIQKIDNENTYPVMIDKDLNWVATEQTTMGGSSSGVVIRFVYDIVDKEKTKKELFDHYNNSNFYALRDDFIKQGICESEAGALTRSGVILEYYFTVAGERVGAFMIGGDDCKQQ